MSVLQDRYQRKVTYLRLSVTDRCDLRCVYCMAEEMRFLPRAEILSLEELFEVAAAAVELGVTKIRITGGEPLVRRGVVALMARIAALPGLRELTLTTNGTQLVRYAEDLRAAGVARINVSLDTLRPGRYRALTRHGELSRVLAGIEAAQQAGFERIKLNAVVLKGRNEDEIVDLVRFARRRGLDISFIEEMPLGAIDDHDRSCAFFSSESVKAAIEACYPLTSVAEDSGGPARYYRMADSPSRIGFISPYSHNFCDTCNRVRVTVQGRLLLCLGQEHSVDLRRILRSSPGDRQALRDAFVGAMALKPKGHDFDLGAGNEQVVRFMNATGG